MKLLQSLTGIIERFAHDGAGVIQRPEGKPILAYGTIPGEEVQVKPFKRTKDGMRAELESITTPSPDRVVPRCQYAGTCGGCKWQHVDYQRQLAEKLNGIQGAFAGAAATSPDDPSFVRRGALIEHIVPCPEPFYYRNRMDYVFGKDGELGLKMPNKWWATLDLETCFLLSEQSVEVMKRVREWTRKTGLPFWNAKSQDGFFRYCVIREGKNTSERMVMIVTGEALGVRPQAEAAFSELPAILGDLATSVVWGINASVTDLSVAGELIPLKGDPWIHETVNGVSYKITPNAFFQTNSIMAAKLQDEVLRHCEDPEGASAIRRGRSNLTILDLYCGSGFFSLALAKRMPSARIVGIELSAEAIECAKENAVANGVTAEYFASTAESYDWKGYAPDVVILDPPRGGMHPKVIETILEAAPPVLVYVSCSYTRFLQEFAKLGEKYTIESAVALDLFPHTPHVECVFKLVRK